LAVALFFNSAGTLLAGTTGTISGTITDQKTTAPLAGVRVSAVSPTGQYSSKTDAKGFYSFTGVTPDTYTVSFELTGYQPASLTGVNVFADQVAAVSLGLNKSLRTIGTVTARSPGGAFQPTQTQDSYTVTASQISTQLGKADAISETNLLVSLPGVTKDSVSYTHLDVYKRQVKGRVWAAPAEAQAAISAIPAAAQPTPAHWTPLSLSPNTSRARKTVAAG